MSSRFWIGAAALALGVGAFLRNRRQSSQPLSKVTYTVDEKVLIDFKGEVRLPPELREKLIAATSFRGRGAAAMIEAALSNVLAELGVDVQDQFQFTKAAKAIVAFLGQPAVVRNLLQAILSDTHHHEPQAAQSHYHNNGFDKLVLVSLKSGVKLRLHIW